ATAPAPPHPPPARPSPPPRPPPRLPRPSLPRPRRRARLRDRRPARPAPPARGWTGRRATLALAALLSFSCYSCYAPSGASSLPAQHDLSRDPHGQNRHFLFRSPVRVFALRLGADHRPELQELASRPPAAHRNGVLAFVAAAGRGRFR